ncbi:MAG TPA: type II secretion system protein GspC [Gammaproteobacteria bacterium]|nr:type II secretion system protein GspC [Gammaproteobacteria bacterium]
MNAPAMDTAKILSLLKARSPEQWLRTANRYVPPAVTGLLVLLIAHQLAELTWILTPGSAFERPAPVVAPPPQQGESAAGENLSALSDSHLFGKPPAAAPRPAPVVDAPETTLSLTLTGLVARSNPAKGLAIISSARNQQKNYAVGQSIVGGGGATLQSVYTDRVILNRNGRLETLHLPKELASPQNTPVRYTPAPPPSAPDDSLRSVISDNASKLTNVMRVAPQVEGGKMVGFRLNPGRDRKTFEALGLKPGDVVTEINGTVLDDPSRGLQVFQSLGESTQANVTVLRNGVSTVLVIDTSQLQSLGENRQ